MDVSIVMPTYNKCNSLNKTLISLIGQKNAPEYEVVVIDDCSDDETGEMIRNLTTDYRLRYLRNDRNLKAAKARNIGLKEAQGRVVIFLDDDRLVERDYINNHYQSSGPGKAVIGTRYEYDRESDADPANSLFGKKMHYYEEEIMKLIPFFSFPLPGTTPLSWLNFATGNIAVWRDDVLKLGGFDESFCGKYQWRAQDTELGYRMSKMGVTYIYQPNAANYHFPHSRGTDYFKTRYQSWRHIYDLHSFREIELLWPLHMGRISFLFCLAELEKKDCSEPIFSKEYYQALYRDCALADQVIAGTDITLNFSPAMKLRDNRTHICFVSGNGLVFQFQGMSREIILRLNSRTSLSEIIHSVYGKNELSPDEAGKFRNIIADLIIKGIARPLCFAELPQADP